MLRIGVPNKGTLSDPTAVMLREAGYRQRTDARDLVLIDPDNGVEFFYLRPRDIATYVAEGQVEVGITGRDLLVDGGALAEEVLQLDFGRATFRYAAEPGTLATLDDLEGRRIATSYPGLVARDLEQRGLSADIVRLDGAVETAIRLGVAEVVADVVSSGTTLRQAGLAIVGEPLLESEAVLIARRGATLSDGVELLVRRLNGVIIARRYVMVEYDVRREALDEACAITPGIESPTISPLQDDAWAAVRSMVPRRDAHTIMDRLHALGARGVIVFDILACRL
jgi:ATP phosphoribosyltransferase